MRKAKQKRIMAIIRSTESTGHIFGVEFIKRSDGTLRKMQARLGVKKGVTGKGLKFDPKAKGLIVAYEMPHGRFRMIPVENITHLSVDGLAVV